MHQARVGKHCVNGNECVVLVKGRENVPHKFARTADSQIGNNDHHDATLKWNLHTFTVRQYSSIVLFIKNEEMKCQEMVSASKVIWDYLLSCKNSITAEYLLVVINLEADWESWNVKDTSKWKLDTEVF